MELYLLSTGAKVTLTDKDVAAPPGGQGTVYAKGSVAYKVYHDPSKMIPMKKIQNLSVLTDPLIIRPQDVLTDSKHRQVGYTMRYLRDTYAFCQLFPKAFKDRNKVTTDTCVKLVRGMQKTWDHIHEKGYLIVDGNEMNFLVDKDLTEAYFIDTDNYETPGFPCVAIMPNIRDWHTNPFSKLSDYFSFAVITFNLFTGIHPFKGKHPNFKFPIDEETLEKRMKQNVTVFDPKVVLPGCITPFNQIPPAYLAWYKAMFVEGKRLPPPTELVPVVVITPKVVKVTGTDNFDIAAIMNIPEDIIDYRVFGGTAVTVAKSGIYVGTTRLCDFNGGWTTVTPKSRHVIVATAKHGNLVVHDATQDIDLPITVACEGVMSYNGAIYFKNGDKIYQLEFVETATKIIPSAKYVSNAHEKTTKMYDGVAIQLLMGKYFVTVFPRPGETREFKVEEIQGQVVDAKFDNGIMMVVAVNKGKYTRYVFRFASDYSAYELMKVVPDINYVGLNFVVRDDGICCMINESDEVELFWNKRGNQDVKVVSDPKINNDITLAKNGMQILFFKGGTVYSIKMKK